MDILGIDIAKAKFDVALLMDERARHAAFPNSEAGFQQLLAWLAKHRPNRAVPLPPQQGGTTAAPTGRYHCRPNRAVPLHACMEATGNGGLDLADFLHDAGVRVSIVNPARIKAYGESELARNKTDRLPTPMDAALIARFCRAHVPPAWAPPAWAPPAWAPPAWAPPAWAPPAWAPPAWAPPAWAPPASHLRVLRELVRCCDALKATRVQERHRQQAGFASPEVARSIAAHLDWLDPPIEFLMTQARQVIATDAVLTRNLAL